MPTPDQAHHSRNECASRRRRGSSGGRPTGFDKRAYISHGTVTSI
uniref:Putative truncated transposase n=1 Tax=Streptomyces ambofaciens (strain ATCC 23877 / 3486 / DSM 40053 / JCM 4204 / NBRC 12836 / NRRL B-2516) TaxID=278992 RepID=Q1RR22_STRA7|nr:putative truncated transposase [Streptomyces ambofaciens ATCC 23877]CAI78267.1 putative truncated transposase [Streptomyces ambofaciens ATCC 23877]CAJ87774.1 putative truncated transposase [Streptomyces ambofaciens ATCC 23877]CAJ89052.1 putative truncated transposase [Streptomyces ambofaciens ATCC 23877]